MVALGGKKTQSCTELLKCRTQYRKVLNNLKLHSFTTSENSRYFKLIFVSVSFCPCLNLGFLQVLRLVWPMTQAYFDKSHLYAFYFLIQILLNDFVKFLYEMDICLL